MKAAFSTRPNTRSCHTCVFNHFSFTDSTLGWEGERTGKIALVMVLESVP